MIQTLPAPTQAKHTPGPWLYGQNKFQQERTDSCWEIGLSLQSPDAGGGLSGISNRPGDESYLLVSGCLSEADARLIAAAPELLEALQEYLMAGHKEARRKASIKAKTAIAKATEGGAR